MTLPPLKLVRSPDGVKLANGKPLGRGPTGPWRKNPPWLALGCGVLRIDGWIHLDKSAMIEPDVVHNLQEPPMPFEDSSIGYVWASNVIEHLRPGDDGLLPALQDIWRILKPGGFLEIEAPTYPHPAAISPDHKLFLRQGSFTWFCVPYTDRRIDWPRWYGYPMRFKMISQQGYPDKMGHFGLVRCRLKGEKVVVDPAAPLPTEIGYRRYVWLMQAVKTEEEAKEE